MTLVVVAQGIELTGGAKFWLRITNELEQRGTNDVLVAVVDGLKGFPEAIEAVFPQALEGSPAVGSYAALRARCALSRS